MIVSVIGGLLRNLRTFAPVLDFAAMANHKRRRPKHQRAGCLMCKPHKDERGKGKADRERPSVRRRLQED